MGFDARTLFYPAHPRFTLDMDVIFALAHSEGVSPVTVSLRKDVPPAGSAEADEILGLTASALKMRQDSSPSPDAVKMSAGEVVRTSE